MKTVKQVLQLAMVAYEAGDTSFMCHAVGDVSTQLECDKTVAFIKQTLGKYYTLTNYLRAVYPEYSEIVGENHDYETPIALAYRIKWWRDLIESVKTE